MDAQQVKQIIEQQLAGTQVIPSGEGCSFEVTVVGDLFGGLSPVKKQQLVYGCLTEQIADRVPETGINNPLRRTE